MDSFTPVEIDSIRKGRWKSLWKRVTRKPQYPRTPVEEILERLDTLELQVSMLASVVRSVPGAPGFMEAVQEVAKKFDREVEKIYKLEDN